MAIHMMTSGTEFDYLSQSYGERDIPMKISHVGCVLQTYERNGYDDSDFYAVVWTGSAIEHIEYASTRGWSYCNSASVDATPEVLEQVYAYLLKQQIQSISDRAIADSKKIVKGSSVKVVKGRKVAKGTEGTVFAIKSNDYDKGNPKVMIRTSKGIETTYMENLILTQDNPIMITEEEITGQAEYYAQDAIRRQQYRSF